MKVYAAGLMKCEKKEQLKNNLANCKNRMEKKDP